MSKPVNLPADLVREWAINNPPPGGTLLVPQTITWPDADYNIFVEPPPPDASLGLRPMRNLNGQIVSWIRD